MDEEMRKLFERVCIEYCESGIISEDLYKTFMKKHSNLRYPDMEKPTPLCVISLIGILKSMIFLGDVTGIFMGKLMDLRFLLRLMSFQKKYKFFLYFKVI